MVTAGPDGGSAHPPDRDHRPVARVHRLVRGRLARRGRQVQVGHDQRLLELRAAGDQRAVGGDQDRVPVEDQLVLPADHVGVGQRGPRLPGPPHHQVQPHVVLAPLVGRGVRHREQGRARAPAHRHRAAVLPQVLADGDRDLDALVPDRQPEHRQRVTRHEVAELVEYPVVRQVVLGRGDDHPPVVQQRRRVQRGAGRQPGARGQVSPPVQVAGHDRDPAEPFGRQPGRHRVQRRDRRLHERRPQRQVLHRVAGQHHLGEHHDPGPARRRPAGPLHDHRRVSVQVPDRGIDLSQRNPQHRHPTSLGRSQPPPAARFGRRSLPRTSPLPRPGPHQPPRRPAPGPP